MLNIKSGRIKKPFRMMITGDPGVGKTHLASEAPKPLFLDFEDGTNEFEVDRLEVETIDDLREVFRNKEQLKAYKTIVIDSITSISKLLEADVLAAFGKKTIAEIEYGKGVLMQAERLEQIVKSFMGFDQNIIFIAHSKPKNKKDPLLDNYDFLSMHCPKDTENFLCASMDHIGYLHKSSFVKNNKIRGTGQREISFAPHPAHLAKTRLKALDGTFEVEKTNIFEIIAKGN